MNKLLTFSGLCAGALAFGGVQSQCFDDCSHSDAGAACWDDSGCSQYLDCIDDHEMLYCAGQIDADTMGLAWPVQACYQECDSGEQQAEEVPIIYNPDTSAWMPATINWWADEGCSSLAVAYQCEPWEDTSTTSLSYYVDPNDTIYQLACDSTCGECDESVALDITGAYTPHAGECFCDVGDDNEGVCVSVTMDQ